MPENTYRFGDIQAVPDMRQMPHVTEQVIRELRDMAAAQGAYRRFSYVSPHIRRVWLAAALIIESYRRDEPEEG